jgi:TatD DNase family protein
MYIDIHRHTANKGNADLMLRNLFPSEVNEINSTEYCSLGLHPWHVKKDTLISDLDLIKNRASESTVLAIGEAGIDKAIKTDFALQLEAFYKQIQIANEVKKPMIIHCVRAYDQLQAARKIHQAAKPWIIHWYNASKETGLDLITKGCYLSFGHMLFKESSKAFKVFKDIPLENIFFETDDSEASIKEVYHKAAELKHMQIKDLQQQIKANFLTCFGIEL